VDGPVIIANNSFLAGYSPPMPLVATLVEAYSHIDAVLLTDINPSVLAQYIAMLGSRARVLSGVVSNILQAHALGADGVLCMEANVIPELVPSIWSALDAGDHCPAEAGYWRLAALAAPIARCGNPRSLKAALAASAATAGTSGSHTCRYPKRSSPTLRDRCATRISPSALL
jgi:dihydrodipicolinate synthase/N-acetylneuraminate lyase